ncbi:MAG: hypothetical protein N4A40_15815 [Tissierellales bacterium]|jgi:hypothetical protein|nr:hypothetical protein [Tissierellales bacterium]
MAKNIKNNENVFGKIYFKGDIDTYVIEWEKSGKVEFHLEPMFDGLELSMKIYDEFQNQIYLEGQKNGTANHISMDIVARKSYYIQIKHIGNEPPHIDRNQYMFKAELFHYKRSCRAKYVDLNLVNISRDSLDINPNSSTKLKYISLYSTTDLVLNSKDKNFNLKQDNNTQKNEFHFLVNDEECVTCKSLDSEDIKINISETGDRLVTLDRTILLIAHLLREYNLKIDSLKLGFNKNIKIDTKTLIFDEHQTKHYHTFSWFKDEILKEMEYSILGK